MMLDLSMVFRYVRLETREERLPCGGIQFWNRSKVYDSRTGALLETTPWIPGCRAIYS